MSRKVGEFSVDNGSVLINTSIQDLFDDETITGREAEVIEEETEYYTSTLEDDDTVEETVEETTDEVETTEDESEEESLEEESSEEVEDTTNFKDYSNAAILALSLKDLEPDLIDVEVNKNLDAEQLINIVKSSVEKQRTSIKEEVASKYEAAAEYIEEVINGMSQQSLQAALYNKQIADIQLTGEESDEDLESLVKPYLLQRGTLESEIDDMIQVFKDKGTLYEKAEQSIVFHKERERQIIDENKKAREEYIKQQTLAKEQAAKTIRDIIGKGSAKGLSISKDLETAIFKPTEIVEDVDQQGRKVVYKVPLIEVKYKEFYNDVEQQVAFMQLLANNFDFTSLTTKAKSKVNKELLNIINNRTTSTTGGSTKNYFSD